MDTKAIHCSKTQEFFYKINDYTCLTGLLNLWGDDVSLRRLPSISKTSYYICLHHFINLFIYVLMFLEIAGIYNRDNFNAKQLFHWIMYTTSDVVLYILYLVVLHYKNEIKELSFRLIVQLKNIYNDHPVEREMIRRTCVYLGAYLFLLSLAIIFYGFDSLIQVLRSGKPFITIITVWPDEEDRSSLAAAARIGLYFLWWILVLRSSVAYILAIATTICLSHQFKNLQSYFRGLRKIFREKDLNQFEMEDKYERAFKVGIKLHSDTLWCTRQCEAVYGLCFSSQVIMSVQGLAILMIQLVNTERTIVNLLPIITTTFTILVTTGVFLWTAGDVTIEASKLATSMYFSGWEHCERSGVRKLLAVAMTQAQKTVAIRGFGGAVALSYGSYLSMVKSSYSVFSVIY